ncbi:glycoside hydrolase family 3 C-terminal domain-containing protein [Luteolibacter arcticus]|uniref:beta-glucosidase n=1 Tax=Luteolibacter arcticus TaxID=1581411 RepID=A0ABT3GE71_9BACT|nr:glycoside hydrolase family 3 N-terminal domain-containing protein [Luteolibacter arcticus]MCW1921741.1 glycoside hydrolase family 3 C-terminal domain-containing protein [Luteolibacter arcticus]
MTRPLYLALPLLFATLSPAAGDETSERIEAILSKLTLEEKLGQLRLVDGHAGGGWKPQHMALAQAGVLGGTFNVRGTGPTSEMQRAALATRHKIPLVFAFDVIHGYRTIFPVPLGEAASWDPDLAERCTAVAAKEARSANVSWTFAPVADIARDPRWGRIVEGSGEDPVLSSAFTAARVRGFQGKDISAPDRMMACLKHFAGSGEAEGGRDYNFADVSVRALRETHFPPFLAGLKAGAGSIMPSFSAIDGVPATSNPWLLQDVLRKEWGFGGVVVSDYDAVGQLVNHRVSPDWPEAGQIALRAGLDMEIWGSCLMQAEGLLDDAADLKLVDDAVRRVLRMKFQLGLFDKPFGDAAREKEAILHPDHLKLAREAAAKSCVLLKNSDNTLPIPPTAKKIAIVGPMADDKATLLGSWTGDGRPEDAVTLVEAVRQRLGDTGTVIHSSAGSTSGFSFRKPSDGVEAAKDADYVLVVIGEAGDMTGEATSKSSLDLPQPQLDLVQKVHSLGKPYAVILMTGRPLTATWLAETCPAILLSWYGGTMGGPGIADVLFGDVNPSGKLPVTFPRSVGQIPLTYNSTPTSRPLVESDKWTSKYTDIKNSPLWAFGHGLSYTSFQISPPLLETRTVPRDGSVRFQVSVTNQGERDGDEVVQVYIRDEVSLVTRPVKELKAFKRVSVPAGKNVVVDFEIPAKDLGCWTPQGKYLIEPGTFTLMTGGNSTQVKTASFSLE